jgi:endonuclease YncB( thermonuclease family)
MPIPRRRYPDEEDPSPKNAALVERSSSFPIFLFFAFVVAALLVYAYGLIQQRTNESPSGVEQPSPRSALKGPVKVVDGDTIDIGGVRVRLFGIDAPERSQPCFRDGHVWACGQTARKELAALLYTDTRCFPLERDMYGRIVAQCFLGNGTDIQSWMVSHGWALAYSRYSHRYEPEQAKAKAGGLGIHGAQMAAPEAWRAK